MPALNESIDGSRDRMIGLEERFSIVKTFRIRPNSRTRTLLIKEGRLNRNVRFRAHQNRFCVPWNFAFDNPTDPKVNVAEMLGLFEGLKDRDRGSVA